MGMVRMVRMVRVRRVRMMGMVSVRMMGVCHNEIRKRARNLTPGQTGGRSLFTHGEGGEDGEDGEDGDGGDSKAASGGRDDAKYSSLRHRQSSQVGHHWFSKTRAGPTAALPSKRTANAAAAAAAAQAEQRMCACGWSGCTAALWFLMNCTAAQRAIRPPRRPVHAGNFAQVLQVSPHSGASRKEAITPSLATAQHDRLPFPAGA